MNANGMDDTAVRNVPEPVKGIGNSSTLHNDAEIMEEISIMLPVDGQTPECYNNYKTRTLQVRASSYEYLHEHKKRQYNI